MCRHSSLNEVVRVVDICVRFHEYRSNRDRGKRLRHVRKLKGGEDYEPWSWSHILHFREHVPQPELLWATAPALYSGQRQSDCLAMLWSDCANAMMHVVQAKTGKKLWISMHRELRKTVDRILRRSTAILTNRRGTPWTSNGFRSSWGKAHDRDVMAPIRNAGLVFHGLKKSADHRPVASDG
jgi:integrase